MQLPLIKNFSALNLKSAPRTLDFFNNTHFVRILPNIDRGSGEKLSS